MDSVKKSAIRINTMAIILIVIFCIAISPVVLQNDTFYTIKIGEFITNNGIKVQTDPFTWHENLEYTFPHWGYDLFIYKIYSNWGLTGIYVSTIILASILGILIYYTNCKLTKNRIISFFVTMLTLYLLKGYICARAQLVTFILFILTIYSIEKFLETKKIRYAIILVIIPTLIANIHLATFPFYFVLYLPYFAEYVVCVLGHCNVIISESVVESVKNKIKKNGETDELKAKLEKEEKRYERLNKVTNEKFENPYKIKIEYMVNIKWLAIIFIICIFTGFLTPLGTTPYTYLVKTMQGISTKNISEHLPVVLANDKELLLVLAFYIAALCITKTKIRLCDLCMIAGLTLLSIFTRRQSSMLYLIGAIILNKLICDIINSKNSQRVKKIEKFSSKIISIVCITCVVVLISLAQYKPKRNKAYISEKDYPVQAAEWIKENLNSSDVKLYNEYNYGSYLIYKDIPVFIDSRCDLYLPEFNKDVQIFKDFLNMNGVNDNIKNIEKMMDKYELTHILIKNSTKLNKYLEVTPEKYKKIYPTEKIEDNRFTIYERIVVE